MEAKGEHSEQPLTHREDFESYFEELTSSPDQIVDNQQAYSTAITRASRYIRFFHHDQSISEEMSKTVLHVIDAVYVGETQPESLVKTFAHLVEETHKTLGLETDTHRS